VVVPSLALVFLRGRGVTGTAFTVGVLFTAMALGLAPRTDADSRNARTMQR
jgi:hypothetical protein